MAAAHNERNSQGRGQQRKEGKARLHTAAWGTEVAPGKGLTATIQRRSNLSVDEWLNDFYSVGRPVIVTDATEGWPIFEVLSDEWVLRHFNVSNYQDGQRMTIDRDTGLAKRTGGGGTSGNDHYTVALHYAEAVEKAAVKKPPRHRRWSEKYNFKGKNPPPSFVKVKHTTSKVTSDAVYQM
jgi:hypothetical protein